MLSGEKLRLLRNWKGLPQKQAASLLGISQPAYSKLEKKKVINGEMLKKIKKAFGCTDRDIERIDKLPPPKMKNLPYLLKINIGLTTLQIKFKRKIFPLLL